MMELAQIKKSVLLVPHESFDIVPRNEAESRFLQSASLDTILRTGEIHTFQHGKSKSQYIWNAISHTFSSSQFEAEDVEGAVDKVAEEAGRIYSLKNTLLERGTPLVSLIQDFSGYNTLLFAGAPSFNFVVPYLASSDYSEETAKKFVEGVTLASNGNKIISVELSKDMMESMHLKKVDGLESVSTVPWHRISETIDEYCELATRAREEAKTTTAL